MGKVFVIGHKNPDTDAVVSAMAYAALRNAAGDREYVAARIDHVNDETKRMLRRFDLSSPVRIKDMRTQVSDIDFDTPPALEPSVTMDRAWKIMDEVKTTSIPVVNPDGTLYGTLSAGDIATYNMNTITDPKVNDLPLFNLLGVIEGHIICDGKTGADTISGRIVIALPQSEEQLLFKGRDNIVLAGDQPELVKRAIENKVNALIICEAGASCLPENIEDCDTTIISTPFDALRVSKLIYQSAPISRACSRGDIVCFRLSDYLDDVREKVLKSRFRSYPVLDAEDKVVGTLSRYHLLRPRKKQLVLVDHNEAAQAVPGLDQAEILEIIDHHRLADIQTTQPIHVRNEPVGSTTTIVAEMYQENGITPTTNMAGLMAAAILSDTVMFKSPTCTKKDIAMAERLARIAHISLQEIGRELFAVEGAEEKPIEELFRTDYKVFHIAEHNFGVSQITCADASPLLNRRDEFMAYMQKLQREKEFNFVILMITDVLQEGSHLLYVGSDDDMQQAFGVKPRDKAMFLPGVMSRKKQIIPMLTALWG